MYSVLKSYGLNGLNGFAVAVEADVSGGLPAFSLVGLPDSAVRESADRVRAAIKNLGVDEDDIIFCGRQAIDGDTAQVGPEMAEHLGIPQITGALSLNYADGKFVVVRENENYQMTLACAAPLLVTVTKSEKEPRFASIKGKMKARKAQIPTLTVADLDIDPATVGLKGSPTKVKKAFTPTPPEINGEIITEEDADAAVDMLFEKLVKAEVITR